jgi:hypothetical protein
MKQNNIKRIFILISALFYLSSCEPTYKGKHRFRPNQVVYYRIHDDVDIILDTVRDKQGRPGYIMVNKGNTIVLDMELSYTRNQTTN